MEGSELRAAAEELFSLPNWENRTGPWKDIHGAIMKLRAAYLATHRADDAEPITVEWLREIGFKAHGSVLSIDAEGCTVCYNLLRMVISVYSHPERLTLPHIKTRRQLRDLLAALGVTDTIGDDHQ